MHWIQSNYTGLNNNKKSRSFERDFYLYDFGFRMVNRLVRHSSNQVLEQTDPLVVNLVVEPLAPSSQFSILEWN
jgi:hypothetical protein